MASGMSPLMMSPLMMSKSILLLGVILSAVLAWNELAKVFIESLSPVGGTKTERYLVYAVGTTVLALLAIALMNMMMKKPQSEESG